MLTPTPAVDAAPRTRLQIGDWWADPATNELDRGGETTRLEPKAMEVLMVLASRPGRVVSREELFAAVWPGVVVGDEALTQSVNKLRRALGDKARAASYIETISKRGYRLIAGVRPDEAFRLRATAPSSRRRRDARCMRAAASGRRGWPPALSAPRWRSRSPSLSSVRYRNR